MKSMIGVVLTVEEAKRLSATDRYQYRKAGAVVPKFRPGKVLPEFWPSVNKTPSCWLWTGPQNSYGYGRYKDGRDGLAHRHSWRLANGTAIPDGMVVMHRCDVPLCVNPAHLTLGTHSDNRKDAISKNRHAKGEKAGHVKLTEDDVRQIRALYVPRKVGVYELGRKFGVDPALVHRIVHRKSWKHVA
jgi:hypothetical protein